MTEETPTKLAVLAYRNILALIEAGQDVESIRFVCEHNIKQLEKSDSED